MKSCFRCSRSFPRTEFYAHPMMADGLLGKCKECTRRDALQYRTKNIERVRAYDRTRARLPHVKARIARISARWARRHTDRRRAHYIVASAVRAGRIVRPSTCQQCGNEPRRIEAHHGDYSRPLDVQWLCKPCHAKADQERRAA